MPSYQQDDSPNQVNQVNRSLSSLSLNSARRMQLPSSYSNTNSNIPPANNDYRPSNAPPPLKKKPSLSFTSIASDVASKSSSIRNTSMSSVKQNASNAYGNVKRASNIMENHQQGKMPSMSDVKFGYQMSKHVPSSSYHSSTMTPKNTSSISPVGDEARESRIISPFSEQKDVIKKKRAPPPPPPSRGAPKKEYVEALYDLEASQDGDLTFSVGDRIEILEKSDKSDDWWKGRIGNRVGMFPGLFILVSQVHNIMLIFFLHCFTKYDSQLCKTRCVMFFLSFVFLSFQNKYFHTSSETKSGGPVYY